MLKRTAYSKLWEQLSADKSMIMISGPRQAGKTTLARQIEQTKTNSQYFNWDIISNKQKLINDPLFFQKINRIDSSKPLIIFDEIHKYPDWKNYLKGVYDEFKDEYLFLITGSGRLDLFRKGGDSLAGRYFMFRLFPFTLSELSPNKNKNFLSITDDFHLNADKDTSPLWQHLSQTSGFPEPFTKGTRTFFNNWHNAYIHQLIREDIFNFSAIKNIATMELLYSLLPSKVGSNFSINSIARDLQVSFDTVKNWMELFETVFLAFKIGPWTQKISRAITKEKKWYLYNYAEIENEASRFENMVALELLRAISFKNDSGLGRFKLNYIRNKDNKEVDFIISDNHKPVLLIETKLTDTTPSKSLKEIQENLKVPAIQLVNKNNTFIKTKNSGLPLIVSSAHTWLSTL